MKNFKLKGLKYNQGKYDLYNDRFVFFPPKLIDILSSIYGEGAKSLLVWLGKKAGWTLIQNWEDKLKPKTPKLLTCADLTYLLYNIIAEFLSWTSRIPLI